MADEKKSDEVLTDEVFATLTKGEAYLMFSSLRRVILGLDRAIDYSLDNPEEAKVELNRIHEDMVNFSQKIDGLIGAEEGVIEDVEPRYRRGLPVVGARQTFRRGRKPLSQRQIDALERLEEGRKKRLPAGKVDSSGKVKFFGGRREKSEEKGKADKGKKGPLTLRISGDDESGTSST